MLISEKTHSNGRNRELSGWIANRRRVTTVGFGILDVGLPDAGVFDLLLCMNSKGSAIHRSECAS